MLIRSEKSILLVIDIQRKLAPAMSDIGRVVENTSILIKAAAHLNVPQLVSEQISARVGYNAGVNIGAV